MSTGLDYVFTRDYVDNNRINLQHYLWVELFGYHIHPKIPTQESSLRIADIGTGTGIWLTDLACRLPTTVRLDGLDVSLNATPLPQWLPANVTLRSWDLNNEPPEDLLGVYDIVHIRNFTFVLLSDEAQKALNRLIRMIKPGGYLQWGEADVASFRIESTNPDNKIDAMKQLLQISQGRDSRLKPTWVPSLPAWFSDAGLVDVEPDVKEAPPHLALANHECNLVMHDMFIRNAKSEEAAKSLRDLMNQVAQETRIGSYWAFTRWTVIGRKPIGERGTKD